jgi:uncharacterized membrane protein (Fun14 family)
MVIPLIIALVLAALVMATAKAFKVPFQIPLVISIGMYGFFALAAMGVIPVAREQFQMILSRDLTAIAMYGAVAALIFFQAFFWMKQKASQSKN